MYTKTTRLLALTLCFVLLLGALTGCGSKSQSSASTTAASAASHDTLTISMETEPTALHAAFATATVVNLVSMQMFEPLIRKVDGEFVPCLATEWQWADDNKSITFTLREGVTFHNVETMTAEDVAFTYNTAINTGYTEGICGIWIIWKWTMPRTSRSTSMTFTVQRWKTIRLTF